MTAPTFLRALAALVLTAGCATTSGRRGPFVEHVDIVGNRAVKEKEIVSGLATHPPRGIIFRDRSRFDPVDLEIDHQRIQSFYQRHGYFSAAVTDTKTKQTGNRVDVQIAVREGEPTRIAFVDLIGLPDALASVPEVAAARRELELGTVYRESRYTKAKKTLQETLLQRGYAFARVDGTVRVNRPIHLADIRLDIESGPLARFGSVTVRGLGRVPMDAVQERIEWQRGERFDPAQIEATRGQLHALGFFGNVRIDYPRDRPASEANLEVHLTEAPRDRLRVGGGAALDDAHWEVHARADYTRLHVFGPMTTLRVDARPAYLWYRGAGNGSNGPGGKARLTVDKQDFVIPRATGLVGVDYELSELEAYSTRGPGARIGLTRRFIGDLIQPSVGWRFRYLDVLRVHPGVDPALAESIGLADSNYRLGAFEQSLIIEDRDQVMDPHRGVYGEIRVEEGGPFAGGALQYGRGQAEARGYVPIGGRVVAAARARYGRELWGQLPITERFFGGGAANHRGFAQRRLSPVVRDDEEGEAPIGGEEQVLGTLETRLDLFKLWSNWFGVVVFTDVGDVVVDEPIDYGNLHYAAGAGLRYDTLAGPIRFDFGYRLNRTGPEDPAPGDPWTIHFSLGQAF